MASLICSGRETADFELQTTVSKGGCARECVPFTIYSESQTSHTVLGTIWTHTTQRITPIKVALHGPSTRIRPKRDLTGSHSGLGRATFCAIVRSAAGEPSDAAAELGAALDGATAEAEAADGAAAIAPPTGDIAALAVLLLLMSVSDAPRAGDEACPAVVCGLVG